MKRLVVAAPSSGSGKTTFCMGLMAALVRRGLVVQPGKVGPDYIDTAHHVRICGRSAINLDAWLMEPKAMRTLFARRCRDADITIVEGVMGLYDGMGDTAACSTAEMAKELALPVILLVDAGGMAASAAALVKGFRDYDPDVPLAGVVFNHVYGDGHYELLRGAVERDCGLRCFGYLPPARDIGIPSRHLGLMPDAELADTETRIGRLAELVEEHVDLDSLLSLAGMAAPLEADTIPASRQLPCRIAIARDKAFHFYYEDGLAVLESLGAELIRFSPLEDIALPDCDGVYLGGGFPEIFAAQLSANVAMRHSIAMAAAGGKPIYGECGGYMYLTQAILDAGGIRHEMCGILPGEAVMQEQLSPQFGYVEVIQRMDTILGPVGLKYRAHEFHQSAVRMEQNAQIIRRADNGTEWYGGASVGNTLGSYAHTHFAGSPELACAFLEKCHEQKVLSWKEAD